MVSFPARRELASNANESRDQELRFTVHDGPDYFQLKVSVFTDDKRTDLIGEAWIDLKKIIVQGGGQDDLWQTLTCRGKYAGEIRVEITFYDTRPKPERPAPKARPQPAATEQENGSVKSRTPMKRRPLPSDPVTGEAPVTPPVQPSTAPPKASPAQDPYQTPPRAHAKHASHSGFVSNHSPLQSVEYQTPPSAPRHPQDQYSPSVHGQHPTPPQPRAEPPRHSYHPNEPFSTPPRHYDERDYSPSGPTHGFANEPRGQAFPEHFDHLPAPVTDPRQPPSFDDERPPPPPAHRSSLGVAQSELNQSRSFESPAQKSTGSLPMRHDVLRNEAHRHSIAAQPVARPTFRAYDSAPPAPNPVQALPAPNYEPPRHHSYDVASYDAPSRSMQATVEDAPDSPSGHYGQNYRQSPRGYPEDPSYGDCSSPAPLNLSRSPGASPLHQIASSRDVHDYDDHPSYGQVSPSAGRDFSTSPGRPQPHSSQGQYSHYGQEYERNMMRASGQPGQELPSSLVPGGVDPSLTQELTDRIQDDRRHHDRRYTTQVVGTPPRGRFSSEPPPSYADRGEMVTYQPPQPSYDHRPRHGSDVSYSGGPEQRMRRPSPSPPAPSQQMIKRKSVSPAPPPAEDRRKSDVPFGPDSFDSFNTNLAIREEQRGPPVDPDAKIVTHDGREIDPSDHLPMESWAPEPEKKDKQVSSEPRARPSPGGAQPMPPSGRRQLRIAARPQPPPAAPHPSFGPSEPHTPPQAGRNRLHKKTRSSAVNSPAGAGSSPLAPTPDNYQDRQSPYNTTPTRGARPSHAHYDYPNENNYGSAPPIPAKVPIGHGGGAMMSGGLGDDALMHEMSNIDIGAGRSRRRGGY